jgi:hypothetical protein
VAAAVVVPHKIQEEVTDRTQYLGPLRLLAAVVVALLFNFHKLLTMDYQAVQAAERVVFRPQGQAALEQQVKEIMAVIVVIMMLAAAAEELVQ